MICPNLYPMHSSLEEIISHIPYKKSCAKNKLLFTFIHHDKQGRRYAAFSPIFDFSNADVSCCNSPAQKLCAESFHLHDDGREISSIFFGAVKRVKLSIPCLTCRGSHWIPIEPPGLHSLFIVHVFDSPTITRWYPLHSHLTAWPTVIFTCCSRIVLTDDKWNVSIRFALSHKAYRHIDMLSMYSAHWR